MGETRLLRDKEIRAAVVESLRARRPVTDMIIHELDLRGMARVDVAVVSDGLYGVEIKSDLDSLRRLPDQVAYYGRVMDCMTLVTTRRHVYRASEIIPVWWGLWIAEWGGDEVVLTPERDPAPNPKIDPLATIRLLWCSEVWQLLREHGQGRGYSKYGKDWLNKLALDTLPFDAIRGRVRQQLRTRQGSLRAVLSTAEPIHTEEA